MTAHEEQSEGVVPLDHVPAVGCRHDLRVVRLCGNVGGFAATTSHVLTSEIDHPSRGHLNEPAARVVGQTLGGPLEGGREQGVLNGVLRVGEIAEAPDDGAEHLRREVAQQVLVLR